MSLPDAASLIAAVEATWPPADRAQLGRWTIRDGRGGGKRVSAATFDGGEAPTPEELATAEQAMRALRQAPLVQLRADQDRLDATLAAAAYAVVDPVVIYAALARDVAARQAPVDCIEAWPLLAIMEELWDAGGIGPARRAVMARAEGSKTALLGRIGDRAGACAFVACAGPIAMMHALEVSEPMRRQGLGRTLTQGAADWAVRQGAAVFALAVTEANRPANALYRGLGMQVAARYHYRLRQGG